MHLFKRNFQTDAKISEYHQACVKKVDPANQKVSATQSAINRGGKFTWERQLVDQ